MTHPCPSDLPNLFDTDINPYEGGWLVRQNTGKTSHWSILFNAEDLGNDQAKAFAERMYQYLKNQEPIDENISQELIQVLITGIAYECAWNGSKYVSIGRSFDQACEIWNELMEAGLEN